MDLLDDFFKFIKTQRLPLDHGTTTLLTLSGGLDSMVMADLFHRAGLPFAVAHCNFQLRGLESDADEQFVEKAALSFEVPFFVKRFETEQHAEDQGISTQMAARALRYSWFAELAQDNQFPYIATAHHLNDSVETTLLNFVRGSGLPGLSGIPVLSGHLLRPMLFATRMEIVEHARVRQLNWREDSSNASDHYNRNYLRHHIMPRMEDLNQNFLRTAARNMERIGEARQNLDFLTAQWLGLKSLELNPAIGESIDKQKLAQLPSPEQALRQLLQPFGFDTEQSRQLATNLEQIGLELHSNSGWQLLNDRQKILLKHQELSSKVPDSKISASFLIKEDDLMLSLSDGSKLFMMPFEGHPSSATLQAPDSALVDAKRLQFPLYLRHWQAGDQFQPLGMEGKSQKLQDFFTNHKISRFDKEKIWLLFNANHELIWVLGWRLDERYKIQVHTHKALKFNWIK